jgi:hypothetical protein
MYRNFVSGPPVKHFRQLIGEYSSNKNGTKLLLIYSATWIIFDV